MLIGIGIATVLIKLGIWHTYSGQLDQMREATQAATKAANAASDGLEFSNGNFDRMMSLALDQTIAQIESAQAAENAVKTTQAQMRLDQRDWLGAQDETSSIAESGPLHSSVSAINKGRSPAIEIYCRIAGTTKAKGDAFHESDIVYPPGLPIVRQGTLFPNAQFPLTRLAVRR